MTKVQPTMTPFEFLYHYRIANRIEKRKLTDLEVMNIMEIYLNDYKQQLLTAN